MPASALYLYSFSSLSFDAMVHEWNTQKSGMALELSYQGTEIVSMVAMLTSGSTMQSKSRRGVGGEVGEGDEVGEGGGFAGRMGASTTWSSG